MSIKMTIGEFDRLVETLDEVTMEDKEYIPSKDDLLDYIEKHPERYYLYLLWFIEHKPVPQNAEEKKILKRINTILNRTIELLDDEEDTQEEAQEGTGEENQEETGEENQKERQEETH